MKVPKEEQQELTVDLIKKLCGFHLKASFSAQGNAAYHVTELYELRDEMRR